MLFQKILEKNGASHYTVSGIVPVTFENTKSGILLDNGSMAYCCAFSGLEGLFRKDQDEPFKYGRKVCDMVKIEFNCGGFFTSDELPRYGITRRERRALFEALDTAPGQGDLIAMFAYNLELSQHIYRFLIQHFDHEMAALIQPEFQIAHDLAS